MWLLLLVAGEVMLGNVGIAGGSVSDSVGSEVAFVTEAESVPLGFKPGSSSPLVSRHFK